eukprot:5753961-Prymnesium_polylepis.1
MAGRRGGTLHTRIGSSRLRTARGTCSGAIGWAPPMACLFSKIRPRLHLSSHVVAGVCMVAA